MFISNKYNRWLLNKLSAQLSYGIKPSKFKESAKLSDIKPNHYMDNGLWISTTISVKKKSTIINGFKYVGVTEAIQSAQETIAKVENSFRE